jgi:hypothetical protein
MPIKKHDVTTDKGHMVLKLMAEGWSFNYAVKKVFNSQTQSIVRRLYQINPRIKEIVEMRKRIKRQSVYNAGCVFAKYDESTIKRLIKESKKRRRLEYERRSAGIGIGAETKE